MSSSMKQAIAVFCMMPWLAMAMSYVLSVQMKVPDFELVKVTAVIMCALIPVIMYMVVIATFDAGRRVRLSKQTVAKE